MAYTTIDDPSAYFQTALWTGNGSARSITLDGNSDMQPDWVWIKRRNSARNHALLDSVRGGSKQLISNSNAAEGTDAQLITSFDSDGFSLGTSNDCNSSSDTFVGWSWKAGTSFTNDASSTGIGSIDSAGSVSTTAGFSIIGWTGTNANGTIAHGLGSVPKMIIIRRRESSSTWVVYHVSTGNTGRLALDETSAFNSNSTFFNNTSPTSTTFSVGSDGGSNGSTDNYIAYCFAEKKGYSKFGSYTGNGSDTQFIYTGFAPAFVLWKNTNESDNHWCIIHNKAETFNGTYGRTSLLRPNDSGAEIDGVTNTRGIDFLSNGFCLRSWGGSTGTITANESGDKYIFMCFAENPFVTSTGVPATAR